MEQHSASPFRPRVRERVCKQLAINAAAAATSYLMLGLVVTRPFVLRHELA
jgi:hypothetical protein